MIRYIEVDGVHLEADSPLPAIDVSEEGRRMGHIPGWALMTDPDYLDIPPGSNQRTVLDRVTGKMLNASSYSSDPATKVVDSASGQTLVQADPSTNSWINYEGETAIDPNRWTVWAVVQAVPDALARNYIAFSRPGDSEGGISLSIAYVSTTGSNIINIYEYDSNTTGVPIRLGTSIGINDDLALVMATFSVEHGLHAFINGELAGAAPDDKRPLTRGYEPGNYNMFRFFMGRFGMAGILNLDLAAPENTAYRQSIEGFVKKKYEIGG